MVGSTVPKVITVAGNYIGSPSIWYFTDEELCTTPPILYSLFSQDIKTVVASDATLMATCGGATAVFSALVLAERCCHMGHFLINTLKKKLIEHWTVSD